MPTKRSKGFRKKQQGRTLVNRYTNSNKVVQNHMAAYVASLIRAKAGYPAFHNLDNTTEILRQDIVEPYKNCKFAQCTIIKRSIEIWVNDLHKQGKMSLSEIDRYFKVPVNENQVFDLKSDEMVWCPAHEDSHALWFVLFTMLGVLTCKENSSKSRLDVLISLVEKESWDFLISGIVNGSLKLNTYFNLEPGQPFPKE